MLLLLDNYDSFTYNLYHYVCSTGVECRVVRNDEVDIKDIEKLRPEAIMISPGPGRPADSGITPEVVAHFHNKLPVLGICLGFQAMGEYFGAKLVHGEPVHGKTSTIICGSDKLFKDLPPEMEVMRYHSLVLEGLGNTPLDVIAQTIDGVPMAIKHEKLPLYGLQFHPESILTPHGLQMLKNWVALVGLK